MSFFSPLSLPALFPLAVCGAAIAQTNDTQVADTHQSLALELINILSATEAQLNTCTDAASVEAAIPQFLELSKQTLQLNERQKALPEPTVQDYLAAQSLVGEFNTLVQAIKQHLDRLQEQKLLSPELSKILALPRL